MTQSQEARLFEVDEFAPPTLSQDKPHPTQVEADHATSQPLQLRLAVRPQVLVEEFHLAFGLPISPQPTAEVSAELTALRQRLLSEEVSELAEAIAAGDLEGIAGELADVAYVLYGTALTFGIDLDAAVAEIHNSNMSKLDANGNPVVRDDGKVLKGPQYRPPDLRNALGLPIPGDDPA